MPSFADSIFLFVLALLLFGPKKLPVLARELGKWMGEFRRASNEFKMQMDEELRTMEQADRQKQIAAMEAAAPIPPPLNEPAEPEHPHMRHAASSATGPAIEAPSSESAPSDQAAPDAPHRYTGQTEAALGNPDPVPGAPAAVDTPAAPAQPAPAKAASATPEDTEDGVRPIPIAVSGSLKMMPPATGLPTPRSRGPNAISGLVDALPEAPGNGNHPLPETESIAHAD